MSLINFKRETIGRIMASVEKTESMTPRQWNQGRRNWPLGIGGTTTTILRGTAQAPIGPGETGTIQTLNVLSGSWDTTANPTVDALLPTVAFEITQDAVDAGGAVWVIQLPDNSWEVINAECVADETGWGSASLSAPVADTDIGLAFIPMDQADTIDIPFKDSTFDTATGQFSVTKKGIWDVDLSFNLSHNESNSGRETFLRLWDVNGGVPIGREYPIGIGRNQPGTDRSLQAPFAVTTPGQPIRFEIGGGDTISSVLWNQVAIDLNYRPQSGEQV